MGRKSDLKIAQGYLAVAKTNGFTIADFDLVLALQMATIAEDRARRNASAYFSTWGPNLAKQLTRAKRKGLVIWDRRKTKGDRTTIAGLKLTRKGMKVLSVGGGQVFLSPRSR